jgi:hypothetical protein
MNGESSRQKKDYIQLNQMLGNYNAYEAERGKRNDRNDCTTNMYTSIASQSAFLCKLDKCTGTKDKSLVRGGRDTK